MKFIIEKITETTSTDAKNKFIITLTNSTQVETDFGKQTIRKRFSAGVDQTDKEVGDEIELRLLDYEINTTTSIVENDKGEEVEIKTQWLKKKVS